MPMLAKRTTRDIVGDYIDNENRMEYLVKSKDHLDDDDLTRYDEVKLELQKEVRIKIKGVDSVVLEVKRKEYLIDAEVDALKEEIERLKTRRRSIGKFKDFVNKFLLPMVIEEVGNADGVWETDIARYRLYETYGPVDVDTELISKDFIKVEIKESIDKVKARNAAISADKAGKDMPEGINIWKVKRVRRS